MVVALRFLVRVPVLKMDGLCVAAHGYLYCVTTKLLDFLSRRLEVPSALVVDGVPMMIFWGERRLGCLWCSGLHFLYNAFRFLKVYIIELSNDILVCSHHRTEF